jgi:hypothetical protein
MIMNMNLTIPTKLVVSGQVIMVKNQLEKFTVNHNSQIYLNSTVTQNSEIKELFCVKLFRSIFLFIID